MLIRWSNLGLVWVIHLPTLSSMLGRSMGEHLFRHAVASSYRMHVDQGWPIQKANWISCLRQLIGRGIYFHPSVFLAHISILLLLLPFPKLKEKDREEKLRRADWWVRSSEEQRLAHPRKGRQHWFTASRNRRSWASLGLDKPLLHVKDREGEHACPSPHFSFCMNRAYNLRDPNFVCC